MPRQRQSCFTIWCVIGLSTFARTTSGQSPPDVFFRVYISLPQFTEELFLASGDAPLNRNFEASSGTEVGASVQVTADIKATTASFRVAMSLTATSSTATWLTAPLVLSADCGIEAFVRGPTGTLGYSAKEWDGVVSAAGQHGASAGATDLYAPDGLGVGCAAQPQGTCGDAGGYFEEWIERFSDRYLVQVDGCTYSNIGGAIGGISLYINPRQSVNEPPFSGNATGTLEMTVTAYPLENTSAQKPVAEAGSDQTIDSCDQPVQLNGSASRPQDPCLEYRWSLFDPDGNEVSSLLDDQFLPNPKFVPGKPGDFKADLFIVLNGQQSSTDSVIIRVSCPTLRVEPDSICQGEAFSVTGTGLHISAVYDVDIDGTILGSSTTDGEGTLQPLYVNGASTKKLISGQRTVTARPQLSFLSIRGI